MAFSKEMKNEIEAYCSNHLASDEWYKNAFCFIQDDELKNRIIAEQRKGINYELDLSKKAYRRMQPFIDQLKEKLIKDGKINVSVNDHIF